MKPKTTWILIADGTKARVLQHKKLGGDLVEVKSMRFSDDILSISEIRRDNLGRAFSGSGVVRSAIQPHTDPKAKREADFIALVAENLNQKYKNKEFDRLVIFAAKQALHDLRKSISKQVKEVTIAEVAKDLTNVPDKEIGKHLEEILRI